MLKLFESLPSGRLPTSYLCLYHIEIKAMKYSLLITALLLATFASGQVLFEQGDIKLSFDQMHHEMGVVKRGDKRTTSYTFTNQSDVAVEIEIVDGCSCTTLDWTRGPIAPGKQATIDVLFDSTEKEKSETVDIDITLTNTDPKTGNPIFILLDYTFELEQ